MEKLGDDEVNYSSYFITDRLFQLVNEFHIWANEISNPIEFHFICASYKQKQDHFATCIYLRCHRFRENLQDLYDVIHPEIS